MRKPDGEPNGVFGCQPKMAPQPIQLHRVFFIKIEHECVSHRVLFSLVGCEIIAAIMAVPIITRMGSSFGRLLRSVRQPAKLHRLGHITV